MDMNRSWMYLAPRSSETFISGLHFFLNFAFEKSSVNGKILCPCSHCLNMLYSTRRDIVDHIMCWGFRPEYSKWVYHGEGTTTTTTNTIQTYFNILLLSRGRSDMHLSSLSCCCPVADLIY